jgi:hypothetical protein
LAYICTLIIPEVPGQPPIEGAPVLPDHATSPLALDQELSTFARLGHT